MIELQPNGLWLKNTDPKLNPHLTPAGSIAKVVGEQGEEEVYQLLLNNKKIKFEKLIKNWQEIEDLQIDIYGETAENIYFIEVKSWSENFYHSAHDIYSNRQKIIDQQVHRQTSIQENFSS